MDDIVDEIKLAIDAGFTRFYMSANVFSSRRDWTLAFCDALRSEGIEEAASWVCMTRVEFVDLELLKEMKRAGCANIAYGVESAGREQWRVLKQRSVLREHSVAGF